MPVLIQIVLGSIVLLVCLAIHIWTVVGPIVFLQRKRPFRGVITTGIIFKSTSVVILVLLASHTVQIYVWSGVLLALNALPSYESQIYFSLVSYTTLGYGDVTISDTHRIFGAMSSVNGILAFGLSTAFLVGLFSRLLSRSPDQNVRPKK